MSSVGIYPINRKASNDCKDCSGFTLIELIVVMTIAGIIAGLVTISWRHFNQARSFQVLTQQLLTELRLAAVEAENTGAEMRVYFDPVANTYAVWKLTPAGVDSENNEVTGPVLLREITLPADISVNLQYDSNQIETATDDAGVETVSVIGWPDTVDYIRFGGGQPATAVQMELKNPQDETRLIMVTANGRASEVNADEMVSSATESYP